MCTGYHEFAILQSQSESKDKQPIQEQPKIDEQPMSAHKILRRELSEYYWGIITKPDAEGHTTFKDWIIEAMEEYAHQSKAQPKVTDEAIEKWISTTVDIGQFDSFWDAMIYSAKALRDGKINNQ
jgi:hypothetical protein